MLILLPDEVMWFLSGLIFLLAEFIIPGFVIFFFGVGAWVVALFLWFDVDLSFSTQLLIFLVSSIFSLVVFRRYGKPYFKGKVTKEDVNSIEDVKGERAVVTEDIIPVTGGKVEFHGTLWNAESDVFIAKGTTVEIVERNNLTLKVISVQEKG
ncbi:MAG: NfeD family protein [Bacteroidetes bacterium]|nr:NfeD family protein [Bacteroidota bacterium]